MMQTSSSHVEVPADSRVALDVAEEKIKPTTPQQQRRRALVIPREHGAWGMLLVPLATGAGVALLAGGRVAPVLLLTTAVLSLFWLRTPAESWLGASSMRAQTPEERRLVRNVVLPLAAIAAISLTALFWEGHHRQLIWLGAVGGVAFGAQVVLKKIGRATRMAAEIMGAIALTSTAPAAYYVATGRLDATALALWMANWIFAADQIHFVWVRIRGARAAGFSAKFKVGWTFLVGQTVLCGLLIVAFDLCWIPAWALLAFVPIVFRGFAWFAANPQPIVVRRLGLTELAHAVVFGILLIAGFGFAGLGLP